MTYNLDAKKHTLRLLHHNVAVVSAGKGSDTVGATITWFCQSSFDPPLVMMAVKADSRLYEAITSTQCFSASLVAQGDKEVAAAFFRVGEWADDKFGGFAAKPHDKGGAILAASPAWFVCNVVRILEEGDHHIIVGQVIDTGIQDESASAMCLTETDWKYGG